MDESRFLATSASWVLAAAVIVGCGPSGERPGGGSSDPRAVGRACAVRLPVESPELDPPPEFRPPVSRIALDVAVHEQRIAKELGARVPKTLATARRQRVGAPGEVTYTVTRGEFHVGLAGGDLVVSTEVRAAVEVCKPLGPFCPTYGRCSPIFDTVVRVPLELDAGFDLAPSRVGITTRRGCVLQPVGVDVTPLLEKQARRRAAAVQHRIDGQIPPLGPYVEAGWKLLHVPIALDGDTCLEVSPRELAHSPPTEKNGVLRLRLAALARVEITKPCREENERARPTGVPPPRVDRGLAEGIDVRVPIRMSWSDVAALVARGVSGGPEGGASVITSVRAQGAAASSSTGAPRVALGLSLGGSACGEIWVRALPYYDEVAARVRFREVTVAPGQERRVAATDVESIARWIEQRAAIVLPIDVAAAPSRLRAQVEKLADKLPPGVEARVEESPPRVERFGATDRSFVAVVSLRGEARAEAE